VVILECPRQHRIEALDQRSQPQCRAGQAADASTRAGCTDRRATGTRADLRAESAHASAGRVLHNAERHAQNGRTRLGPQHVGVGDVQVIARDGDVEIVLQRQRDRVIQRQIKLAVVHELVNPRRVG
jgi:hypothetical protein